MTIVVLAPGTTRTPRERDIVRLLVISATNAASADALSISPSTVMAHVARSRPFLCPRLPRPRSFI